MHDCHHTLDQFHPVIEFLDIIGQVRLIQDHLDILMLHTILIIVEHLSMGMLERLLFQFDVSKIQHHLFQHEEFSIVGDLMDNDNSVLLMDFQSMHVQHK